MNASASLQHVSISICYPFSKNAAQLKQQLFRKRHHKLICSRFCARALQAGDRLSLAPLAEVAATPITVAPRPTEISSDWNTR